MSVNVYAVSGSSYTLTVDFQTDTSSISGSQIKVYRVFDRNNVVTGSFAKYNVKLGDATDGEALGKLSDTLASYVAADDIKPDYTGTTAASGKASFNVTQEGVYLITATAVEVNNVRYTPKATIVRVPYISTNGQLVDKVTVELKYERRSIGTGSVSTSSQTTSASTPSVSTSKSSTSTSPVTTTTVTSSAFNNSSSVSTPSATSGTTTTVTSSDTGTATTTVKTTTATTTTKQPELPQTGQLWWPVPVMFVVGVLLFLVGIIVCCTNSDEKK